MSLGLTRRDIQSAHRELTRYHSRDEKAKAQTEHLAGTALRTALVGGSALAFATLATRFPNPPGATSTTSPMKFNGQNLGPVPTSLAAAILLHGAAFMKWGGKYDEQLHAVGDGALAFYLATVGAGIGASMAAKASQPPATTTTSGVGAALYGYRGTPTSMYHKTGTMSPIELHALAQQRRAAGVHPYAAGVHPGAAGVHPYAAGVRQAAGVHVPYA